MQRPNVRVSLANLGLLRGIQLKNLFAIVSMSLLCVLGIGLPSYARSPANRQPIPKQYFGLVATQDASFPLQVPYGQWRSWDMNYMAWPNMEICQAQTSSQTDPCFVWMWLDRQLASTLQQGVNETLYTLSRSPVWSVNLASDPDGVNGTACNYYQAPGSVPGQAPGQCLMPVDLNADGSGTNQIWKNWVTAIATHVNDPTYKQTHSHIHMWEPWNEFYRSDVLASSVGNPSFEGTFAQLVRLTEDLRCIVTGKGKIHNYPNPGQTTACTQTAIDPSAVISSPSTGQYDQQAAVLENFLYCNGTGTHAPKTGSMCTTGTGGSDAIDVINYHLYAGPVTPELVMTKQLPNALSLLQPVDLAKPLISGEGSWGDVTVLGTIWLDPYAQAGFIPRFFALYWSNNVKQNYWYSYDGDGRTGGITDGTQLLHPQGDAWLQTYNWLAGSTPDNATFCQMAGTVYTCDFTKSNGQKAELVWDSQYGQDCSTMNVPIVCGATAYTVPPAYSKDWIDLVGGSHRFENPVMIGANPILLESDSQPAPPTGLQASVK